MNRINTPSQQQQIYIYIFKTEFPNTFWRHCTVCGDPDPVKYCYGCIYMCSVTYYGNINKDTITISLYIYQWIPQFSRMGWRESVKGMEGINKGGSTKIGSVCKLFNLLCEWMAYRELKLGFHICGMRIQQITERHANRFWCFRMWMWMWMWRLQVDYSMDRLGHMRMQ